MSLINFLIEHYDDLYVTADQHFGHTNIIKLDATRAIFKDVDEMDQHLIEAWNAAVGPEDVVIHLGDFALTSRFKMDKVMEQLNGQKILWMGNHDACRTRSFWHDRGFIYVTDKPITIKNLILSHRPLPDNLCEGKKNIHGHLHSRGGPNCVSVELTDWKPVKLSTLV